MSDTCPTAHIGNGHTLAVRQSFHVGRGEKVVHSPQSICINAQASSAVLHTDREHGLWHNPPMSDPKQIARDAITKRMAETGLELSALAVAAGVAPSTLTRFYNGQGKSTVSTTTLAKLDKVPALPGTVDQVAQTIAIYKSLPADKRKIVDNLVRSLAGLDEPSSKGAAQQKASPNTARGKDGPQHPSRVVPIRRGIAHG